LELIQSGLTLEGGGRIILSDSDQNFISGISPGITLTNVDNTISGAGQIGDWQTILINQGTIVATGTHALTIDTGSNVVINSGILEATGAGGLDRNSDISNSGLIWADGGNITIEGAVTGPGGALISGGSLEFFSASSINVTFAEGSFGTLVLDNRLPTPGKSLDSLAAATGFRFDRSQRDRLRRWHVVDLLRQCWIDTGACLQSTERQWHCGCRSTALRLATEITQQQTSF
jgi:hypothetical protein